MDITGAIGFCFPRATYRRHALAALGRSLSRDETDEVWKQTLQRQRELKKLRPRHSLGTNLILRYMEWDAALFRALEDRGVPKQQAQHLVQEITWAAIAPLTAVSYGLSRLRSGSALRRVKWTFDLMFRTLFTRPFKRTTFTSDHAVAFDVTACPIAAYFKARGLQELTPWAACSMDHRMATAWGVTLTRTQTIATGHPCCNFRFHAPADGIRNATSGKPSPKRATPGTDPGRPAPRGKAE